jgi:hypothetical protein
MHGRGIKWYSEKRKAVCTGFVHDMDGPSWLFVEEYGSWDTLWLHRDMVVEVEEPLLIDGESYTLIKRLDHPSNRQGRRKRRVSLRKDL